MQQLRDAMWAATAEPPPSSIVIDEIMVREQRRRTGFRLLAAVGVVILAAGAVPALASAIPGISSSSSPPSTVITASEPSGTDLSDLRDWTARAAAAATAALPDGYRMANPPTELVLPDGQFAVMWADLAGPGGERSQLLIFLDLGPHLEPQDAVCAEPLPAPPRRPGIDIVRDCEPLLLGRDVVRVGTWRNQLPGSGDYFQFPVVSHYQHGWALHVWELPYRHPHYPGAKPELVDAPVFTIRQLAELVLHPDLVPR